MQNVFRLGVFIFLFLAFVCPSHTFSQVDKAIGSGVATNTDWTYPCPLPDSKQATRQQFLYLATEMQAAGMTAGNINAIRFTVTDLGIYVDPTNPARSAVDNLTIKIGSTSTASLSTTDFVPNTEQVYTTAHHLPVLGANSFTLAYPYYWNGTDNIVIEICTDAISFGNTTTANPFVTCTTGLSFNGSRSVGADYEGLYCDKNSTILQGAQTTRPNIIFNWTQAQACASVPLTGGAAITSKASVCSNESFKLQLSGASLVTGVTYKWQSSTDGTNFSDINGATAASLTTTQSVSTWYRAVLTCTGGATATSGSVQVLSPLPISGTYTINKTLPASATNFQSFNDAYNFIKCGINGPVVFNVAAGSGVYTEQLILNNVPGASTANTITFNGATGASISYAATNPFQRAVIKLNGADHFVFNSLAVTAIDGGSSGYGYGFQLLNDADSNVISRCTINTSTVTSTPYYAGIVVNGSDDSPTAQVANLCDGNIFSDNVITGGAYGITLIGNNASPNGFNKLLRNRILDFGQTAIYVTYSTSTTIDSNFISKPTRSNDYTTSQAIYVLNLNTRMTISRNTITRAFSSATTNAFYGIYLNGAASVAGLENVISNNQIYGINGGGNVYGIYNTASHNTLIYHNTISLDGAGTSTTASHVATGFYLTGATGVQLLNNNISITRAGLATNTALYFATFSSDLVSDYNNLYVTAGTGVRRLGYVNSAATNYLIDWTASCGLDKNSIVADPQFVNLTTGDLHPANAALDNIGATSTGVTVDITGTTRNSPPDIGAYEFAPPACVTPPTPGAIAFSASGVCATQSVAITLSGNTTGAIQTYQLESSVDGINNFTAIGNPGSSSTFYITASTTLYYRIKVTCSGNSAYTPASLLTVYAAFAGGTYTINKNAPASATNFTSMNAAYQALACGIAGPVVFNFVPNSGPYAEQVIMDTIKGASAINTVTFNGNGNTIQYNSSVTGERAVIKLRSTDHVILDSLVIDASGTNRYGYGVQLLKDADSNVIRRCTIKSSMNSGNYAGVVISASDTDPLASGNTWCDGNLIERNTFVGGNYSITIVGEQAYFTWGDNFIRNNKVLNNNITDFYNQGIYFSGTRGTIIEGNTISRPTRSSVGSFQGIYMDGTNAQARIARNIITNPFGGIPSSGNDFYGLYFNYAGHEDSTVIVNNLIYNVNGQGNWYGIYSNMGISLLFYHNTISFDNQAMPANSTVSLTGFYIATVAQNVQFKNNIITITRPGAGLKYGFYIASGDVIPLQLDYNDYLIKSPGGNNHIGYRNSNRTTLADWQSVTNRDWHSYIADPVYADTTNGNYQPTTAPLNNTGIALGVTNDIKSNVRNTTTPDIGAYEFTPQPCISGVTAGTASVTPNSGICLGTLLKLALTGNSTSGYQVYRWQKAITATGPWQFISDTLYTPTYNYEATGSDYFRCVVTCTGISDTSSVTHVTLNAPLPAGTYTIKKDGTGDYTSFTAAVNAMKCGISGEVIFEVTPDTYAEQVYINRIPGAGPNSRVTFRSATGTAATTILSTAGTATNNYILKLDSASYITFKNLTIKNTSTSNGRVIELAGTASFDSLVNNTIAGPVVTSSLNTATTIFASPLNGESIVISNNTITNGASAIYVAATAISRSKNIVVAQNTISGFYQYGVYTTYCSNTRVTGNTIAITTPTTTAYGIYNLNSDSTFAISNNNITVSSTTSTVYGVFVSAAVSTLANPGRVDANRIIAVTSNTGILYGINAANCNALRVVNNAISIKTTAASSYGLYVNNAINGYVYNNTVVSTATSATNNYAAYLSDANYNELNYINARNNIFSHEGGGTALYVNNPLSLYSDYNLLFTSGARLVQYSSVGNYATLADWQAGGDQDKYSIVYKPSLVSYTDLQPNVSAPEVWAIHGRGVQITGNEYDINNNTRPASLKAGVPDLGAYEFVPTSTPIACVATPAAPAANTKQVFMLGTDTVTTINWGATVPTTATVKRYSGVAPTGLTAGTDYMYFYTDVAVTGGPYTYTINQQYLEPWRGFIDNEERIRLGRTNATNTWVIDAASSVNSITNVITQPNLDYLNRFTGLTNATIPYPPTDSTRNDSTSMGTRFWVGYGHNNNVTTFIAKVGGAPTAANITVKVHGTDWVRTYNVPANTYVYTDPIPRTGSQGAVLLTEGLSDRGISIESDVPVRAYVEASGALAVTGSTMLLPVSSFGYEYYALAWEQKSYDINVFSWFYVIADHDSTLVEITPVNPTLGGRTPNVPFTVLLNKGEVYQVLGGKKSENDGYDLSGSKVRSLSNASGKCYPVGVFSGNSRAFIDCSENFVPFGNYLIQQGSPAETWGTAFVTAPTLRYQTTQTNLYNFYRILVKDPATQVKVNGATLSPSNMTGNFYQYQSNTGDYIEASKPILVAQFIPGNSVTCDYGNSGPEMFYVPAMNQGIRKAVIYRSKLGNAGADYIHVTIPTNGLTSLTIDGSNQFDYTYVHPNKAGYSVAVKSWTPAEGVSTIQSDSAFIALSYGLSGTNSYGVVIGKTLPTTPAQPGITNVYDSSGHFSAFTCVGTPFRYRVWLPVLPTSLTWKFSQPAGMVPDTDSVQVSPVPTSTKLVNGTTYYEFKINKEYIFNTAGQYTVPIVYVNPVLASCTNSAEAYLTVNVVAAPVVTINAVTSGCVGDTVKFSASVVAANGDAVRQLTWNFGDNTTAVALTPSHLYAGAGTYTVKTDAITHVGCIATGTTPLVLKGAAVFDLVSDTVKGCAGTDVTLAVKNPQTGVTYSWYTTATGGTAARTGSAVIVSAISATTVYYVDASLDGCTTQPRKKVTALLLNGTAAPVVTADSIGAQLIRFTWLAIPGANGYQVSVNGGAWVTPSSGSNGLVHVVTGLQPGQTVTIQVKAIDPNGCKDGIGAATATATMDKVFIPTAFTPNGDNLNDVFKIEAYVVQSMQLRIFNQWGEMIFESNDQSRGWDGTYKGKLQPSGTYMYVCVMTLTDGSKVTRKGSVSLVR